MRITRAQLLEAARREVEHRAETDDLLAAYLIGSIVHDQAVLGGSADIDLVLVHEHPADSPREVIGLSDDVHLDIAHHTRAQYAQPRALRLDPWLGPAIYDPLPLHDPQHLFEWAQASARGQFLRADHRAARAGAFLARARQLQTEIDPERPWVSRLARAGLAGANAVATLSGQPAAGRRLLFRLETGATESGCPEAAEGFLRLLGADTLPAHAPADWVTAWARAFDAASPFATDVDLVPERRGYYLRGFQALLESDAPRAILFTLLDTWDRVLATLDRFGQAEDHRPSWDAALAALDLTPAAAPRRLEELEAYLDHLETFVEAWSIRHGA
jgi:hypothetical protein